MSTFALAIDEVFRFRLRQRDEGRLLEILDGPAADAMRNWSKSTMTTCQHVDRKHPIPLWGMLAVANHRMCGSCFTLTDAATPAPDDCTACGGPLSTDRATDVVVIGYDPFVSVLGHVCQACRSHCNIQPPEGEETHG